MKPNATLVSTLIGLVIGFVKFAEASVGYPTPGTENPITYTFTAASTGSIDAYFAGSTAAYVNDLTMLVNGIPTGVFGLNNHTSSYGDLFVMGSVTAGDTIVFELHNVVPGGVGPWYSDVSLNSDGVNHVYSVAFPGDSFIPSGTFVAFEDLPDGGDFNYNDEDFVFTNVSVATPGVPEPCSFLVFGGTLCMFVFIRRWLLH